MGYTVQEVADMVGVSAHTLRYYDREGIMPFLHKDENGNRVFEKVDLQWLQVVRCMKISGFSMAEMREYAQLVRQGDSTLEERLRIFEEHKARTEEAIEKLKASLDGLNYKCWYYRTSVEAGTESIHFSEDGYNQAQCYRDFKKWEEEQLGHPSELNTAFMDVPFYELGDE